GYGFAEAHKRDLPTSHPNRRGQTRKPDSLVGRLDALHRILRLDPVGSHNETFSKSQLSPATSRTVESFDASVTPIESAAAFLEASGGANHDDETRSWSRVRSHFEEIVAFVETASPSELSKHKPVLKKILARYDTVAKKLENTIAFSHVKADLRTLRDRLG